MAKRNSHTPPRPHHVASAPPLGPRRSLDPNENGECWSSTSFHSFASSGATHHIPVPVTCPPTPSHPLPLPCSDSYPCSFLGLKTASVRCPFARNPNEGGNIPCSSVKPGSSPHTALAMACGKFCSFRKDLWSSDRLAGSVQQA